MCEAPSLDLLRRAAALADQAAVDATGSGEDIRAKQRILTGELVKRMRYLDELDLDPLADSLEDLLPGLDFNRWMPMELVIARRAQQLVSENVLFPGDTACSPDVLQLAHAEALRAKLVQRMNDLLALGIDPLNESWEALLPG